MNRYQLPKHENAQLLTGENALVNSVHKYLAADKIAQIRDITKKKHQPLERFYASVVKDQAFPYPFGLISKSNPK